MLSPTEEVGAGDQIAVMAITSTFPEPPPPFHVPLPWHPDPKRVGTHLGKRCAAVINWLRFVDPRDIEDFAGDVPPKLLLEILAQLEKLE